MYGEGDIVNQPGWILSHIDGEYPYPESGEISDATAKQLIGNLVGVNGT